MSDDEERLYFLKEKDQNLFLGRLITGATVVHNVPLEGTQRKFEILELLNAKHWEKIDGDKHTEGTFIAWDLKDTQVKVSATVCEKYYLLLCRKVTLLLRTAHSKTQFCSFSE